MKIKAEIMNAYADMHMDWKEGNKLRNLSFRASESCSGPELIEIMKAAVPDGYNEYDLEVLQDVVEAFGAEARYTAAREGSVCLYIKAKHHLSPVVVSKTVRTCDEFDYDEETEEYRLWWD